MSTKPRGNAGDPLPRYKLAGSRVSLRNFRVKAGSKSGHNNKKAMNLLDAIGSEPGQTAGQSSEGAGANRRPWWIMDD
jgi:hypothetical protein